MADPVEEQSLHMVNSDPDRTPTFTMFGNPDFFFQLSEPVQRREGVRGDGLRLEPRRRPAGDREHLGRHGRAGHRQGRSRLDRPGPTTRTSVRRCSLSSGSRTTTRRTVTCSCRRSTSRRCRRRSTARRSPSSSRPTTRSTRRSASSRWRRSPRRRRRSRPPTRRSTTRIEDDISNLTAQRDTLAGQIRSALNAAAFDGTPIPNSQAQSWIDQANSLISQAQALPH